MIYIKNQQIIIPVAVAVVVGAAAFFGGMQYQKMQRGNGGQFALNGNQGGFQRNFPRGSGAPGGARGANGGAVIGQIISQDDKSITVKLMDGSSKIVLLSGSATISKTSTGTKTDLTTGANVAVFGTTNPDGSVTAQNVQLNPMFRGPMASGMPR